eukprot:197584_1
MTSAQVGDQSKSAYYTFGAQYRYTSNLREHPLFIKPKYKSIKKELYQYFVRENEATDKQQLLDFQMRTLQSLLQRNPEMQSILETLSAGESISYARKNVRPLWIDPEHTTSELKNDEEVEIFDVIKLENQNCLQ